VQVPSAKNIEMNHKKVLILITKSNWGGAQRYVYDLATRLPKDKYFVEVMAGGNGPLITRLQEVGVTADGTLPIGRDVNLLHDTLAFFKLWNILRKTKPDILHVNSSKIGGLGALAGRLARVPRIVFTAHGWAFNENRSLTTKAVIAISYWTIIMLSHKTMAVSESMMRQIKYWPFVHRKVTLVYNGIDKAPQFSQANARHALGEIFPIIRKIIDTVGDKNIFWVGSIGELHHIKGYEYAIKAVRQSITTLSKTFPLKKIIYTIFGEGEERSQLEKLIKEIGLEDNILLMGHTPNIAEYIQAFDVFMLPSLSEGLPYVLLEAGIGHAPVISTAVGGIPEVIVDMRSGVLVQPKNSAELSHAISFMIDHPEERRSYGNSLKDRVTSKFSLDQMLSGIEDTYKTE
jgi:glycosyltransferase involved in cell wall biosynthesis